MSLQHHSQNQIELQSWGKSVEVRVGCRVDQKIDQNFFIKAAQ